MREKTQMPKGAGKRAAGSAAVLCAVCLALLLCLPACASGSRAGGSGGYGVFLGAGADEVQRMEGYRTVVIEPSEFTAAQLQALKRSGKTVYGYLNVGSVEEYRPYFSRFQSETLGVYQDWPDERWADVASPRWRDFVVGELAARYAGMGLDGFFVDNADVYCLNPGEAGFAALCSIFEGLRDYGIPVIVNGGDVFVSECMERGVAGDLFDGVNQETVFTSIDFESGTYGVQSEEETRYFTEYLARAKECGLQVYLLEYSADPLLSGRIDAYCRENGFSWYNAQDLELR